MKSYELHLPKEEEDSGYDYEPDTTNGSYAAGIDDDPGARVLRQDIEDGVINFEDLSSEEQLQLFKAFGKAATLKFAGISDNEYEEDSGSESASSDAGEDSKNVENI